MARQHNLGRGLDALISTDDIQTVGSSSINEIALDQIRPNPDQPRKDFDPEALAELAASIQKLGIIQPVTLRQMDDGTYQIISGERRFRASQSIGLKTIPAYIKTAQDDAVMEMALIENIQRQDLNAIETALAFQKLSEVYHLTHEQLSERLGKKRATISNYIRLLKLPAEIQMGLKDKKIDMSHARSLITVEQPGEQLKLYEDILKFGYSARQVEDLVRRQTDPSAKGTKATAKKKSKRQLTQEFSELQQQLCDRLGTKVRLKVDEDGKGSIVIPFRNEQKLEEILSSLDRLLN